MSAPGRVHRLDPNARSRDFRGTALRLVGRLALERRLATAVVLLSIGGILIGVAGPRILGHATDLLFNGAIGRGLPAGITKQQAVDAARKRGEGTFADMLSGMDVIPGRGVDFPAVARTLLLALGLYVLGAVMVWLQGRLLNLTVQRTITALRRDVGDKVNRLPLRYFDNQQRGELLSRVTNDVDNTQQSIAMTISQLVTALLTVVAVLAMMVSISPLLAGITVLTVPLSLFAVRAITRQSRRLFDAQWRNVGRLNAHIEETYSGFTLVKTFGHREQTERQFAEMNDDLYRSGLGAQFFSGLVPPVTGLMGNLGYVAVAVIGGLQVATGQVSLGSIQAFIAYVRQFNQPISHLAAMYNALQSGVASAERVFEFLDEPEETADETEESAGEPGGPAGPAVMDGTAVPLSPNGSEGAGRVDFDDVSFAYHAGVEVIRDVSLTAEPGSTVAIVGPTGAGKTTLVNLLMRFYDIDSGRILLDDVDITEMSRRSLRTRIGMVLQDTWLFTGTIAENIGYGRPGAGEDEIVEAARAAHVDRFVRTLPQGYETIVTNDGGVISAGEKQLITIARAFLADPQMLILDEATSSVDTRTERLIQRAMRELRRGRTSFVIAHRLSTIRNADVILVLQDGRIVERGNHADLMARRGAYWAMTQA